MTTTRIWMPRGELIGKCIVVLGVAVAFAASSLGEEPGLDGFTPLTVFAFSAVFILVTLLYELLGRGIGLLLDRVAPPRSDAFVAPHGDTGSERTS